MPRSDPGNVCAPKQSVGTSESAASAVCNVVDPSRRWGASDALEQPEMEGNCKRHTKLPHSSKLFCDLLYRFDRVSAFYRHAPGDASSFAAAAREIAYPEERRTSLISVLRAQNGDHPLLEKLAEPGTVAVVTGQQVGLVSGPSYTI